MEENNYHNLEHLSITWGWWGSLQDFTFVSSLLFVLSCKWSGLFSTFFLYVKMCYNLDIIWCPTAKMIFLVPQIYYECVKHANQWQITGTPSLHPHLLLSVTIHIIVSHSHLCHNPSTWHHSCSIFEKIYIDTYFIKR